MEHHAAAIFVPSPAAWRQSWSTSALVLGWASVCWLAGELWLSSNVMAPLVPAVALAWFGIGLGVGALAFSIAGTAAAFRRSQRAAPLFAAAALPLVLFAAFWVLDTRGIPLRARFELSQGQLDGIADRFEAGEQPMPAFGTLDGGWFDVHALADDGACTRLTTAVDGSTTAGLARCSGAVPSVNGVKFERVTGEWWAWRSD
ncbi:MAG: hypothetical protein U0837_04355 [Dehalococcoidia bacterium]|jgi:hypothetical protein